MLSAIEVQWTHDPAEPYRTAPVIESDWHSFYHCRAGEGWEFVIRVGTPESRCGAQHPHGTDRGSCGSTPGHEHPHVWCWHDWHVANVSRRTSHKVFV